MRRRRVIHSGPDTYTVGGYLRQDADSPEHGSEIPGAADSVAQSVNGTGGGKLP